MKWNCSLQRKATIHQGIKVEHGHVATTLVGMYGHMTKDVSSNVLSFSV
jgi:hypothetical protein